MQPLTTAVTTFLAAQVRIGPSSLPRWYGLRYASLTATAGISPTAATKQDNENNDDHDCSHHFEYPLSNLIKRVDRYLFTPRRDGPCLSAVIGSSSGTSSSEKN